ncbi:hypothetical protein BH18ACT1_BH18ACT1_19100 [soil metagenome]
MAVAPEYALPEDAIARAPAEPRGAARLLVDAGPRGGPAHRALTDLPELVGPGDRLLVN